MRQSWLAVLLIMLMSFSIPLWSSEVVSPNGAANDPPSSSSSAPDAIDQKYALPTPEAYAKSSKANGECARDFERTTSVDPKAEHKTSTMDENKIVTAATLAGVPKFQLLQALNYVRANPDRIKNQKYVAVADFTKPGTAQRLFIVNLQDGSVETQMVGQGMGKDKSFKPDQPFDQFSNENNSSLTGKGCLLTSIKPNFAKSLGGSNFMLHGLTPNSNDQDCNRGIRLHTGHMNPFQGRSHGCLSLSKDQAQHVMSELGGGAIICTNPSL